MRTSQLGAFALAVPAIARAVRRHAARVAADRRVARRRVLLPGESMIGIIAALTLRQLLGRGRTVLMGLLALLPILLAVVYRLGSEDTDQQRWVAQVLFDGLIVTTLLPLARARLRNRGARCRDRGRYRGVPPREAGAAGADHLRQAARGVGADVGHRARIGPRRRRDRPPGRAGPRAPARFRHRARGRESRLLGVSS